MPKAKAPLSAVDKYLVAHFVAFAITSWLFEPYLVLGWDLRQYPRLGEIRWLDGLAAPHELAYTAFGALWRWYAEGDPVFFNCPTWLHLMCLFDMVGFGSYYLYALYAWWRRLESARTPSIVYASCMLYSCVLYFAWEVLASEPGTDMAVVFLVNGPYAVMPAVLLWRVTRPGPLFPRRAAAAAAAAKRD